MFDQKRWGRQQAQDIMLGRRRRLLRRLQEITTVPADVVVHQLVMIHAANY